MLSLELLNFLQHRKLYSLVELLCTAGYFYKGYGLAKVKYHRQFRAFEFKVRGQTMLGYGPGWQYTPAHLESVLREGFCFNYLPRKGDCVIDVGAGLGEEAFAFAQMVGPHGKVLAIEANPVTFAGLQFLCGQNKFEWAIPLNLAIYSSNGEVTIEDNVDNYLKNTIDQHGPHVLTVPAVTFDTLVAMHQITTIDFLKVNIEGAERFLIEGMKESIRLVRNICVSCHDFRYNDNKEGEFYLTKEIITDFLLKNGFTVSMRKTGINYVDDYVYGKR